jgi:hypothetical protein
MEYILSHGAQIKDQPKFKPRSGLRVGIFGDIGSIWERPAGIRILQDQAQPEWLNLVPDLFLAGYNQQELRDWKSALAELSIELEHVHLVTQPAFLSDFIAQYLPADGSVDVGVLACSAQAGQSVGSRTIDTGLIIGGKSFTMDIPGASVSSHPDELVIRQRVKDLLTARKKGVKAASEFLDKAGDKGRSQLWISDRSVIPILVEDRTSRANFDANNFNTWPPFLATVNEYLKEATSLYRGDGQYPEFGALIRTRLEAIHSYFTPSDSFGKAYMNLAMADSDGNLFDEVWRYLRSPIDCPPVAGNTSRFLLYWAVRNASEVMQDKGFAPQLWHEFIQAVNSIPGGQREGLAQLVNVSGWLDYMAWHTAARQPFDSNWEAIYTSYAASVATTLRSHAESGQGDGARSLQTQLTYYDQNRLKRKSRPEGDEGEPQAKWAAIDQPTSTAQLPTPQSVMAAQTALRDGDGLCAAVISILNQGSDEEKKELFYREGDNSQCLADIVATTITLQSPDTLSYSVRESLPSDLGTGYWLSSIPLTCRNKEITVEWAKLLYYGDTVWIEIPANTEFPATDC